MSENGFSIINLTDFIPEAVSKLALVELPTRIRQVEEAQAILEREWSQAWGNFKCRRDERVLHLHEQKGMGFHAAQMKTELEPEMAELSAVSLDLKKRRDQLDRILRHLTSELQVRLALRSRFVTSVEEPTNH